MSQTIATSSVCFDRRMKSYSTSSPIAKTHNAHHTFYPGAHVKPPPSSHPARVHSRPFGQILGSPWYDFNIFSHHLWGERSLLRVSHDVRPLNIFNKADSIKSPHSAEEHEGRVAAGLRYRTNVATEGVGSVGDQLNNARGRKGPDSREPGGQGLGKSERFRRERESSR